ncbi:MAG: hypothetical protein KG075_04315, partial [Alphaproteobacteria bacterium]|nr:hypothetical protein [Alphaproteobacteria bacterium]
TPAFSQKLSTLSSSDQQKVSQLLSTITLAKDSVSLVKSSEHFFSLDKLIMLRQIDVMIVGSVAENGDFLLLDIVAPGSVASYAPRDPRRDNRLNPNFNGQINPNFNGQINPNFNGQINPNFNGQINPNFNGQINPNFNGQINPNFNSQINPKWNTSLNPKWNSSLNPKWNATLSGPFIYSLNLERRGFVVRANENVLLLFDMDSEFLGIAVQNNQAGYVVFDDKNQWIAHWVHVDDGGHPLYLSFDTTNKWTGIII